MITCAAWNGRRYAVLGLARSGAATVEALLASGAEVVAWDSSEEVRAKFLPGTGRWPAKPDGGAAVDPQASVQPLHHPADGPPPRTGEDFSFADPLTLDLSSFDAVIVSPGVPLNTHPIATAARAAGVPVIGDIELFAQARASLPPHKVVGITGTNGKSTTTALVHHILRTAGVPTTMGGNIGLPILAQDPLPEGGVYVLELSSYQIDLTQSLDCDVAVLLNITPDHLDRYISFEAYAASKARLFDMQSESKTAIVALSGAAANRVAFGARAKQLVAFPVDDFDDSEWPTLHGLSDGSQGMWTTLQGSHNAVNAAATTEVCKALGLEIATVEKGLRTFPGLPHRMERIADRDGISFVNDSKATNPASAAPALAAFDAIHWILGGCAKSDDLDACAPHFDHVRAAYSIGEAGPRFVEILAPHMPVSDCGTLDVAVRDAAAAARPGEVVLLSPACASFDQFSDFEARGEAFRAAVEALA